MLKQDEMNKPDSCFNKAKKHELIFVLLERDEAAPVAIIAWTEARIKLGKNKADDSQIKEALACAASMANGAIFNCHGCGWKGPYIKACEHPDEPPCCPVCG